MSTLTLQQLAQLRARLTQREEQLKKSIYEERVKASGEHYADLAGSVTDQGDESVADVLTDIDNTMIVRHVAELGNIDSAKERMNNNTYGICVDCGDDIQYERLVSYLTALRCTSCQKTHEHTHAGAEQASL